MELSLFKVLLYLMGICLIGLFYKIMFYRESYYEKIRWIVVYRIKNRVEILGFLLSLEKKIYCSRLCRGMVVFLLVVKILSLVFKKL